MSEEPGREARSLLERAGAEAAAGKTGALEVLIKAHFPFVNTLLRRRFDDVFSEDERRGFFLDVLYYYVRNPHKYDARRPLKSLLCGAAHHNARREAKRRRSSSAE